MASSSPIRLTHDASENAEMVTPLARIIDSARLKQLKYRWKKQTIKRFRKFEKQTGAIICFMIMNAPTPVEGVVRVWAYSTGYKSFEATVSWICALIRKARGSGPQNVSVNFSDDVDEFMGCLEPGLAHVLEDVAEALASEDNELSTLEAEIAELSLKPMSVSERAAIEQLARTELKKAMMTVTSAWKDANFVLPENQLDTSAAEDTNMEGAV